MAWLICLIIKSDPSSLLICITKCQPNQYNFTQSGCSFRHVRSYRQLLCSNKTSTKLIWHKHKLMSPPTSYFLISEYRKNKSCERSQITKTQWKLHPNTVQFLVFILCTSGTTYAEKKRRPLEYQLHACNKRTMKNEASNYINNNDNYKASFLHQDHGWPNFPKSIICLTTTYRWKH